jgi:hypothetical protein
MTSRTTNKYRLNECEEIDLFEIKDSLPRDFRMRDEYRYGKDAFYGMTFNNVKVDSDDRLCSCRLWNDKPVQDGAYSFETWPLNKST